MKSDSANPQQRPPNFPRFVLAMLSVLFIVLCLWGIQKLKLWRLEEDTQDRRREMIERKHRKRAGDELIEETREELHNKGLHPPEAAGTNALAATNLTAAKTRPETNETKTATNASADFGPAPGFRQRGTNDDERARVAEIRRIILANSKERREADMRNYSSEIPGSNVQYAMVVVHGGEFLMGSPESEPRRSSDEGPQHLVKIAPFWMEQFEVTWDEYELFMHPEPGKASSHSSTYSSDVADAVAHPTKPYVEMSFGMGKHEYPAISMTQHAANKYCEWLSAKVGHFYRLPTEAEWEYGCRAGAATAYSFGDDPAQLGDYAWFADNSDGKYQKVGRKKANPWGLHDMHGNVAEWCLDQYDPGFYVRGRSGVANPWNKATKPYPHVVRGGAWDDDHGSADKLRSAARLGSSKDWKQQDPMLSKSIWYLTDAQFVGFRIIRPLRIPSVDEMYGYWNSGVETER